MGRTNVTDDRQTDRRAMTYSEREHEFTFAKRKSSESSSRVHEFYHSVHMAAKKIAEVIIVEGYRIDRHVQFLAAQLVMRAICLENACPSVCPSHSRVTPKYFKIPKYALNHTTERFL